MIRLIAMLTVCALLVGCQPPDRQPTSMAAVEAAYASLAEPADASPLPLPLPPPDDSGAAPMPQAGGPLDFYRDAKALVAKGNALADRGKTILDAAEAEGKVTLDIHIPDARKMVAGSAAVGSCPGGVCAIPNTLPNTLTRRSLPGPANAEGRPRPRLLPLLRRWR